MSLQDITGKPEGELTTSVKATVLYSLSDAWLAYCQALKVQVSDVQALAAQGGILEAFPLLSERLAGIDIHATAPLRPASAPFVRVAPVATSGSSAERLPVTLDEAAALSSLLAASGVPTADLAKAAGGLALRGQSVSVSRTGRRFRPLVRSRLLLARSFKAPSVSMQIFVLNRVLGGAFHGHA